MTPMKDTIKNVSIDLFHQKGYFATSMSEIARACGIQKASIYYHYQSKEDLLYHIMRETMADLTAYIRSRTHTIADIETRMRAAVRSHVAFHLERQKENFIANSELRGLSPDHYRQIVKLRDEYERIFQDLLEQGKACGIFARADMKILSYAILTLCGSGASWFKPTGRLSVAQIAEIYVTFIISGLKQHGTPTR